MDIKVFVCFLINLFVEYVLYGMKVYLIFWFVIMLFLFFGFLKLNDMLLICILVIIGCFGVDGFGI